MKKIIEIQFDRIFSKKELIDYTKVTGKIGRRDRQIIKLLTRYGLAGKKCLDVGPGTGRWLQLMKKEGAAYLAAIDISDASLDRCSFLCDKVVKADVESEKFDFESGQFDVTCAFMILEHLRDPENLISEIIRVTKPGGLLLITIPNLLSFLSRIYVLFGRLPIAVTSDPTHVKYYTKKELNKLFRSFNEVPEIIPTSFTLNPFNNKTFRIPTSKLTASFDDNTLISIKLRKNNCN